MSINILEIGAGYNPATHNPGAIFAQEQVEYFAIDVNRIDPPYEVAYEGLLPTRRPLPLKGALAGMDALPFRDQTFDHVILKNVIGEYSLSNQAKDRGPNDTLSGRTFAETLAGIPEIYRVLQAGGRIAIAEEDTPADHMVLEEQLITAGFQNICMTPFRSSVFMAHFYRWDEFGYTDGSTILPDAEWASERSQYWSMEEGRWWAARHGRPRRYEVLGSAIMTAQRYSSASYIMTAERPVESLQS